MPALGNLDHERFCQAVYTRLVAGEKRADALVKSYRETMYRGELTDDEALKPNARRLANRTDVAARLKEMANFAAQRVGLTGEWAMLEYKKLLDDVDAYTLDHYMARADDGTRKNEFDLTAVTEDQIKRLSEITTETIITRAEDGTETVRRKIKLKGPDRYAVKPNLLDKMADLGGWKAPKKIAPTNPAGDEAWSLERLIGASMAPKEQEKAA